MRTIYLFLSFLVCFVACFTGQSNTKIPGSQPAVRKTVTSFRIVKTPGTDQYQVISGKVSMNKMVLNLVTTKEVMSDSRKLASVGTEETIGYQLEVVKADIKSFTKKELGSSSLQLEYVAP
jgi:hypothetical protein